MWILSTLVYLSVIKAAFEPFQCEGVVLAPGQESAALIDAFVLTDDLIFNNETKRYDFSEGSPIHDLDAAFREQYVKRFMVADSLTECTSSNLRFLTMQVVGGVVLVVYGLLLQLWAAGFLAKVWPCCGCVR